MRIRYHDCIETKEPNEMNVKQNREKCVQNKIPHRHSRKQKLEKMK